MERKPEYKLTYGASLFDGGAPFFRFGSCITYSVSSGLSRSLFPLSNVWDAGKKRIRPIWMPTAYEKALTFENTRVQSFLFSLRLLFLPDVDEGKVQDPVQAPGQEFPVG